MPSPVPTPAVLVGAFRPFEVFQARLRASVLRPGYDQESVDDFLDRVARDLARRWSLIDAEGGWVGARPPQLSLDAGPLAGQGFPMTKFRPRYRVEDVDQLIERMADSLDRLDAYLGPCRFAAS